MWWVFGELHKQSISVGYELSSSFYESALPFAKMSYNEGDLDELMKALADSFHVLADEVQLLSDRKTILEHKLRFAHEQVCIHHLVTLPLCMMIHFSSRSGECLTLDDRQTTIV